MLDLPVIQRAVVALLVIHLMMTAAFLFQIPPHPPLETPAFGMGPFLGALLTMGVLSLVSGDGTGARVFAVFTALLALPIVGPHKWLDPAMPLIWPALIVAQASIITVFADTARLVLPRLRAAAR